MILKKDLKEKIILQLVAQATKKHAASMARAAKAADVLFRAAVSKHAQAALPEVSPSRWAELIQLGMLRSFSGLTPTAYEQIPGRKEGEFSSYGVGSTNAPVGDEVCELYSLFRRGMANNGWGEFLTYVTIDTSYGTYRINWKMKYADLPALNSMERINTKEGQQDAWTEYAMPLHLQCRELTKKFLRVLEESKAFYDELWIIFAGINTHKQLLDQFPAAAKLLPPPAPKRQAVAPKDLIDRANKILETGIPN